MENSWKKPESRMVRPKPFPEPSSQEAEIERENREYAEAQAKRIARESELEDKVGALIGGKYFITNWTDPILLQSDSRVQMSVHRFYPEVGVALDIFPMIGPWERSQVEAKRKLFKENTANYGGQPVKVRYAALDYAMPLANMIPQLEA